MEDILDIIPLTDLALIGIRRAEIRQSEIIRQKKGHTVLRMELDRGWFILKWFENNDAIEPNVYGLLERHGVPTLPLYASSNRALLMEDLLHSPSWRLATPEDMRVEATGLAVAAWYKALHHAGSEIFRHQLTMPSALHPWYEDLTVESLTRAGFRLGIANQTDWPEAVHAIEALKARIRRCPQTFNYDDFAMENLALSRPSQEPLRAIVFDYDCFTIGPAYTDWGNVTYSLENQARQAFIKAYGPVSQVERLLDAPFSTLQGLYIASKRKELPGWAVPLLENVRNGTLLRSVRAALAN